MKTMLRSSSGAFARSSLQLPRAVGTRSPAIPARFAPASRRWASSSAPKIRYGFRGGLLRWGIAVGGIYWYATQGSKVLAEEPIYVVPKHSDTEHDDEKLATVDEVFAARKDRQGRLKASVTETVAVDGGSPVGAEGGIGGLEEEAEGEGAFNPETGEINWDCPCLGGMAHGPCGPEFKEAFSCFVFSKEEPKGMDCIDRFKGMQDCFRLHPEIYGEELEGDDEEEDSAPATGVAAPEATAKTPASPAPAHISATDAPVPAASEGKAQADSSKTPPTSDPHELSSKKLAREQILHETEELVPRKWHDTTEDNEKQKSDNWTLALETAVVQY